MVGQGRKGSDLLGPVCLDLQVASLTLTHNPQCARVLLVSRLPRNLLEIIKQERMGLSGEARVPLEEPGAGGSVAWEPDWGFL